MSILLIAQGIGKVVGAVLAADMATGTLHWMEDSYGKSSWPVLGKHVIQPNIEHHFKPRKFTKGNFWNRNNTTIMAVGLFGLVLAALGQLNWWLGLALALGAMANEVHCWSHRSPKENGKIIRWFQKMKILQTPKHHARHHTDPKNRSYCTMTNVLNPVLDRIRFFQGIEWILEKVFGLKRRVDESVKVH